MTEESGDDGLLWDAERHTLAKVAILKRYLGAWFQIFGRTQPGRDLLYVDGFAGPGKYANHSDGSPIAAVVTARDVMAQAGPSWQARDIHLVFIEREPRIAELLEANLRPFRTLPRIHIHVLNTTFEQGIGRVQKDMPWAFTDQHPLFAFIDPFGPTGVPFDTVRAILSSSRSEVLINFDSDGSVRIARAGEASSATRILNQSFGDESWRDVLTPEKRFRDAVMELVQHYQNRLLGLPNVRYAQKFEMSTSTRRIGKVGYFLIFASQHRLGMQKMKQAMNPFDQTGEYRYSNFLAGRQLFFRHDMTDEFSDVMHQRFVGSRHVPYAEIDDFALNETPYENPKAMLKVLEDAGRIGVSSSDPKRRRGTFNEKKNISISFLKGEGHGAEKRD